MGAIVRSHFSFPGREAARSASSPRWCGSSAQAQPVRNSGVAVRFTHDRGGRSRSRSGVFSDPEAGCGMTGGRRVLVVDDQDDIREMARLVLAGAGYEVVVAAIRARGAEARRVPRPSISCCSTSTCPSSTAGRRFGLLRADEALDALPVAMFSVKSEVRDKVAGLKDGAIDYITKPFGVDELIVPRRRAFSHRRRQRLPAVPTASRQVRPMDLQTLPDDALEHFRNGYLKLRARSTTSDHGFPSYPMLFDELRTLLDARRHSGRRPHRAGEHRPRRVALRLAGVRPHDGAARRRSSTAMPGAELPDGHPARGRVAFRPIASSRSFPTATAGTAADPRRSGRRRPPAVSSDCGGARRRAAFDAGAPPRRCAVRHAFLSEDPFLPLRAARARRRSREARRFATRARAQPRPRLGRRARKAIRGGQDPHASGSRSSSSTSGAYPRLRGVRARAEGQHVRDAARDVRAVRARRRVRAISTASAARSAIREGAGVAGGRKLFVNVRHPLDARRLRSGAPERSRTPRRGRPRARRRRRRSVERAPIGADARR